MVLLGLQANGLSELLLGKGMQENRHKNETEIDGWSCHRMERKLQEKELSRAEHKHTIFVDIQATHMNSK